MRGGSDGQRNVHHLTVSVRCSGIGGDVLVVDIDVTLDEPVVCGHPSWIHISAADVVAVVDDGQRAMYEVARGFPLFLFLNNAVVSISVILSADGIRVQLGQGYMFKSAVGGLAVYILGIDETATHTRLHIDEVQFYDARNVSPVFLVHARTCGLCRVVGGQLQIDTRRQCHLVMAATVVSRVLVPIFFLPLVESLTIKSWFELFIVHIIRLCRTLITKVYVAGQCAEVVHDVIDAEVVAVQGIVFISSLA